jgi:hypothetical protein
LIRERLLAAKRKGRADLVPQFFPLLVGASWASDCRPWIVAPIQAKYPECVGQPIREVDPGELRLPPSRASGVDPWKLHQQIRQFGSSRGGMPPILVYEDPDGILEISDGVTRATRIAKLAPGHTVPVVVIGQYRRSRAGSPCVKDRL